MLPHTHTPNHLHYARVISNPHVNLKEPFNLNRPDGDYVSTRVRQAERQTLCEQVILRGLGRESVPEYKPTRERISFYPRTAYFKRERVAEELKRLQADAVARGLPPDSVDSIYLQGEEAILEHERRNGYDKGWGPNGVQKTAKVDTVFVPDTPQHVPVARRVLAK